MTPLLRRSRDQGAPGEAHSPRHTEKLPMRDDSLGIGDSRVDSTARVTHMLAAMMFLNASCCCCTECPGISSAHGLAAFGAITD